MNIFKQIKAHLNEKVLSSNKFDSFYNLGIDYYKKKNYETAIRYFKFALEQNEIKPHVYYNMALSYQYLEEYDDAIYYYNKFLEQNRYDYDCLYNVALIYYNKGSFAEAVEFFEECLDIRIEDDCADFLISSYFELNDIRKVTAFADRLLNCKTNKLNLYYKIAKRFEAKNFFSLDFTYIDKAIEMYKEIISFDPNYFDAYLSISICYAKKGIWSSSIDFCQKALKVNPKSCEANNQMGLIYYCYDEIEKAVEYYETALRLNPDDHKIYTNLGYAYEKVGKIDKAVEIFYVFINKFPDVPAKDEIENHLKLLNII